MRHFPACLPACLLAHVFTQRLKLPSDALVTETKAAARLEASYSLSSRSATALLSRHDELCDRLAALALELQQALASERDIDTQARTGVGTQAYAAGSVKEHTAALLACMCIAF